MNVGSFTGDLVAGDHYAIRNVLARAAWAVDQGNAEGLIELFTPDALIEYFGERFTGSQGIRAFAADSRRCEWSAGLQHWSYAVDIRGSGRHCTASSLLLVSHRFGVSLQMLAQCRDDLVKVDGQWVVERRSVGRLP